LRRKLKESLLLIPHGKSYGVRLINIKSLFAHLAEAGHRARSRSRNPIQRLDSLTMNTVNAPPKKKAPPTDQAGGANLNQTDSGPFAVNHIGCELAISRSFSLYLRACAPKSAKELRRLRRRLTARIAHKRTQIMGLAARKAAVDTELTRRGFPSPRDFNPRRNS